jgi:hypothetical protein
MPWFRSALKVDVSPTFLSTGQNAFGGVALRALHWHSAYSKKVNSFPFKDARLGTPS